jgi:anaerobic sulfite reductase subunit B
MAFEPKAYKIISIKEYGEDVKLFRVKSNMHPQPGHFIQVSMLGFGESPLASCSFTKEYMDILVRNAGNVTNEMFRLKKGDELFIRGPYGKGYPLEELKGKNLILVAGGTGLAPITSLIEYIDQNSKDFGEITIYFGFRDEGRILLGDRIDKWRKKFNVVMCLDKGKKDKRWEVGYVNEIMMQKKPKVENTIVLMCGPEMMMQNTTNALIKLGLGADKVYWNMERRMECAIGSCGRCLINDLYVCRDGPVFRYDIIKPKLENEAFVHSAEEVK